VPNPFNPSTRIEYNLAKTGPVSLRVYDAQGRLVRTLLDGVQAAGPHAVSWYGRDDQEQPVSSGLYLYRLETEGYSEVRKMMLVK
jgi:flagellar hook assembly protein FlgD